MLKQIVFTALAGLALAAPAAHAADESASTSPTRIEARITKAEKRFAKVCEANPVKPSCQAVAAKIAAHMDAVEAHVGKRIAKIEQKCGSASTKGCRKAADRLAKLQELNARAEALEAKARAV